MKRIYCWVLAFMMVFLMGGSLADTSYQGTVTSGNLLLVQAPFGGKVTDTRVQVGDLVSEGDTLTGSIMTSVIQKDEKEKMRSENSAAVREAAKENGIVKDEPFHIKMCGLTYANCGKN